METTISQQPKNEVFYFNTRYASQSLNEIPVGKWIDKSVGNCGLSYLALTDNSDSVILLPRNTLIKNKLEQSDIYPNLFGVFAGVTEKDVWNYYGECKKAGKPIKLLISYKSFAMGKLDTLLETSPEVRVYVDESQYLLDFALQELVLNNQLHSKLNSMIERVSFFSAHPPKREYLPEYIRNIDSVKYIWQNQKQAVPFLVNTDKPYLSAIKIGKELLSKGSITIENDDKPIEFKKVIIFVNSVEGIKTIAEGINSPFNIAYVTADTVQNDSKLHQLAYRLENCRELPTITIGTSSMLSGMDLYDNETMNVIISTSSKRHTLFDVEMDVPQAICRQRLDTNPHNDKFIFIVDKKNMEDKIARLEETYKNDLITIDKVVDNLNYLEKGKKDTSIGFENYFGYFYSEETDEGKVFYANHNLLLAKKYQFAELYRQYTDGYTIMSTLAPQIRRNLDLSDLLPTKTYNDYANEINSTEDAGDKLLILKQISNKDWVKYLTYGIEQKKVLVNYSEAKALYESRKDLEGIRLAVIKAFPMQKKGEPIFYKLTDVNTKLQKIYDDKGLKRKAKSTDLYEFFELQSNSKRIDGQLTKGLTIKQTK